MHKLRNGLLLILITPLAFQLVISLTNIIPPWERMMFCKPLSSPMLPSFTCTESIEPVGLTLYFVAIAAMTVGLGLVGAHLTDKLSKRTFLPAMPRITVVLRILLGATIVVCALSSAFYWAADSVSHSPDCESQSAFICKSPQYVNTFLIWMTGTVISGTLAATNAAQKFTTWRR